MSLEEGIHQKGRQRDSVIHSAAAMSAGTLGSRILGYLRDMAIYAFFPHLARDAFLVAFQLPNLFRRLLGEGSLAASFIPVYVEKDEVEAQKLANALLSFLWVAASCMCALGIVFMDELLPLVVSGEGYAQVAGKTELTVSLARIMFSYLFLVTTYAYYMSILNALGEFFIPALAPSVFNGVLIVTSIWAGLSSAPSYLAWGVLVGGVLQVGLVFWSLSRKSKLPKLTFKWRVPGFFLVLRNMVPGMMGMGISQLMTLANLYFASRLVEGTHSYLYLGHRILEFPQSLISISLGAALLPILSRLWKKGKPQEMLATVDHHIRLLLFLAVPSAVGMYLLAGPIIEVLFLRGEFSPSDGKTTALVVQLMSFLLVAGSLNKVMVPTLYAIKNTWYPALVAAFCLLLHLGLAHMWTLEYGIKGLVGSMVVSGFCHMVGIFVGVQLFVGPLRWRKALWSQWKTGIAAGVMGIAVFWIYGIFMKISISAYLGLPFSVAAGVAVYFVIAHLLRSQECEEVLSLFYSRWGRR